MQTKSLTLTKAAPILESKPVPDLVLTFTGRPPEKYGLPRLDNWFQDQAQLLADALSDILPGGTMDRLLGILFTKRASLLVIPHNFYKEETC